MKRTARSTESRSVKVRATDRVLMLMALDLDPSLAYTDYEIQCAWRRRISQVHPDHGGNAVVAAAVNLAYLSLIDRIEMPNPVDVLL